MSTIYVPQAEVPKCFCGVFTQTKVTKKEGQNKDREFYCCEFGTCDFFRWTDLVENPRKRKTISTFREELDDEIERLKEQLEALKKQLAEVEAHNSRLMDNICVKDTAMSTLADLVFKLSK